MAEKGERMSYGEALKELVKIKNDPQMPESLKERMEEVIETFEEEWGSNQREIPVV